VVLELRFEPKGGLAGLALGSMVERLASTLVDAFAGRLAQPDSVRHGA
jgi:ribosome-associated toxin RatA of RatAB toxin-antitoxin module